MWDAARPLCIPRTRDTDVPHIRSYNRPAKARCPARAIYSEGNRTPRRASYRSSWHHQQRYARTTPASAGRFKGEKYLSATVCLEAGESGVVNLLLPVVGPSHLPRDHRA